MVSWYLKYRPQMVSELDKENIRDEIRLFLKKGSFPHALLFAGPKGTGKTSAARIIAKILNCAANNKALAEPCNKCSSCREITAGSSLSVIELDAASNRGIDDIRQIREQVKLTPPGRFKVYIIDEAHMLTNEAANALLKTLEEPPQRVIFILATTTPEKIPETIRSRTTIINFKKAKKEELRAKLQKIAKQEKLKVSEGILSQIIASSEGSFRDGTKLLEEVSLGKKEIETHGTERLLFLLSEKKTGDALREINIVFDSGANMQNYAAGILEKLHEVLLSKMGVLEEPLELAGAFETETVKRLIELFLEAGRQVNFSPIPVLPLELAVVTWGESNSGTSQSIRLSRNSAAAQGEKLEVRSEKKQKSKIPPRSEATQASHLTHPTSITEKDWKKVLANVKPRNHSLEALLRSTKPIDFDGKILTVSVFYQFHKEKLEEEVYRRIVEEEVCKVLEQETVKVDFILGERPKVSHQANKPPSNQATEEDIIEVAEEIFGEKFEN